MNDSSTNSCCEPARTPAMPDDATIGRTQKLVAAGGILGAIAASSCCIVPLVLSCFVGGQNAFFSHKL
jgi:mercuric ion transport protein